MDELLNGMSVPAIVTIVYWTVNLIKYTFKSNEKLMRFVPLIAAGLGVLYSVICFFAMPNILPADNLLVAIVLGGASGLTATGFNQVIKQITK
jgi:hypothetical protein